MGNDLLLRDTDVAGRLGVSRSYVWRLTRAGRIPQPTKISRKFTVWKLVDIQPVLDDPQLLRGSTL